MTTAAQVFDSRQCMLGEGPLWHPGRKQLFWFDIVNCKLLSRLGSQEFCWEFNRNVSAAGWIDRDNLLIASETGLSRFNLESGSEQLLCEIEAENIHTRSNDGRADPWGGFWIGTMSKAGNPGQGALYRWLPAPKGKGTLRVIRRGMTTPNAICFDHTRNRTYFADTKERIIWQIRIDPATGWPTGARSIFVDLRGSKGEPERKPDGAVVDSEGCLWNAQWGSSRVARYSPDGEFLSSVDLPTGHTSCPAFGNSDCKTLFVTTARQKLPEHQSEWQETAGSTFSIQTEVSGRPEPCIVLD